METRNGAPEADGAVRLEIGEIAYRGVGVARSGGIVHFVQGACRGEIVRAVVTDERKTYRLARVVAVEKASPDRLAEPDCRLPDTSAPGREVRVPGCIYDHMEHGAEVREKNAQLLGFLARNAGLGEEAAAAALRPPFVSPKSLAYRNKAELHVGRTPDGRRTLGYFGDDNRTVVDMIRCPLSVPAISAAIAETREDPAFARWAPEGSRAVFRWSGRDGAALFVDRPGRPADDGGGAFFTEDTPVLGALRVPARGFWQMNGDVGSALVSAVADELRADLPDSLVDLYCGVGVFGLSAAELGVARVLGVESGRDAVRAARGNARDHGLDARARFECADAGRGAAKFVSAFRGPGADVLADPPRAGLAPDVVRALLASPPRRLFYVSCAPDTLSRDLKLLCAPGAFRLESARLFDMFPRTAHFETLCVLRRKSA